MNAIDLYRVFLYRLVARGTAPAECGSVGADTSKRHIGGIGYVDTEDVDEIGDWLEQGLKRAMDKPARGRERLESAWPRAKPEKKATESVRHVPESREYGDKGVKVLLQELIDGHVKQKLVRLEIALQHPFSGIKDDECGGDDGEEGYGKVFERAENVAEKDEERGAGSPCQKLPHHDRGTRYIRATADGALEALSGDGGGCWRRGRRVVVVAVVVVVVKLDESKRQLASAEVRPI